MELLWRQGKEHSEEIAVEVAVSENTLLLPIDTAATFIWDD